MKQIRLVVEYDGTRYHGWQRQSHLETVQGTLEACLRAIEQRDVTVTGAGRTDAGVHAYAQVASFRSATDRSPRSWQQALNGLLPFDISIRAVDFVSDEFHPRRSARSKSYEYRILNRVGRSGLRWNRVWHIWHELAVPKMRETVAYFLGRRDFSSFRCMPSETKDTTCAVSMVDVIQEDDQVIFRIEADRFLKQMIRVMVGTCVEVGRGRLQATEIPDILLARDRRRAGPTAPPHGLYLVNISYDGWCSGTSFVTR